MLVSKSILGSCFNVYSQSLKIKFKQNENHSLHGKVKIWTMQFKLQYITCSATCPGANNPLPKTRLGEWLKSFIFINTFFG